MTTSALVTVGTEGSLLRRLAILRIAIGTYTAVWTAVRAPHLIDVADFADRRFNPVGPAGGLSGPLWDWVLILLVLATPLFAAAMAMGWRYRITAPATAFLFLVLTTYRNSWGQIFHTENLVVLHLMVLAIAPADRVFAITRSRSASDDDGRWAIHALAAATVCTYVVAGLAKLRVAGWAWVDGHSLLNQVAFDNARKDVLGDTSSPFASVLVQNAWLTAPAALGSMVVELGAPLALLGRRIGAWWSALAWVFHMAVLVFMAILFPYHLLGFAMAPMLPLEEWHAAAMTRWERRRQ